MTRPPDSLAIALWITGSLWVLALLAYLAGESIDWILPLSVFGLLAGIAEWLMRRYTS